jgi:hypothetical protein
MVTASFRYNDSLQQIFMCAHVAAAWICKRRVLTRAHFSLPLPPSGMRTSLFADEKASTTAN